MIEEASDPKSVLSVEQPSGTQVPGMISAAEVLPSNLLLVPVSNTSLFPGMVVPVILPEGKLARTAEYALEKEPYLGIVVGIPGADSAQGPTTSYTGVPGEGMASSKATSKKANLFPKLGVAAKILKKINLPDNQVSVLVAGLQRFEISKVISNDPFTSANVKYLYEVPAKGIEVEALMRSVLAQFKQISKENPLISEEVKVAMINIDGPGKLADFMASVLIRDVKDYHEFLAAVDVRERLKLLMLYLKKEVDVQAVQKRIQDDINQKVSSSQRDFYLNEQLKTIQRELGRETSERGRLLSKYEERLKGKTIPPEAKDRIKEEMEKVGQLHEHSSEFSVTVNYLDWVTSLPWGVKTNENTELAHARKILEGDHYGLKDVKERILEFLAVKQLKKTAEGSILCFVGPPGTGKTSLGKSIASALDRKFFRFSVGGMRDEAEVKGHRRTYVGAMPGKMIQGLKRLQTQNPVFLIDEIDKMGSGFVNGGDPSSALLELLDPEQNKEFLDHYIDIPFDCSDVFFITTANSTDTIPHALLDRMEVIPLHGYTDIEKMKIARQYLIPRQLKRNGLKVSNLTINEAVLKRIIQEYARESGVRNLEKQIAKICRKVAYRVASGKVEKVSLSDVKMIEKYLGAPSFSVEKVWKELVPGVATGLAWTQYGGDVLFIESKIVEVKSGVMLTGSLGKVMQESANIAYTFVRGTTKGLPRKFFENHLLHLHVPSGAVPKDGPSAGVTMASSFYSILTGQPLRQGVAMTGELTLSGKVLPVGGIKEKLLAAKRSGMHTVLLPSENEKDLREIERDVKAGLTIIKVKTMDDVLKRVVQTV